MKISRRTKTRDILPLLDEERLKELLEQIPTYPLKKSVMSMSIREFSDILSDEEAFLKKILGHRNALKALGMLRSYKEQIENISRFMGMYNHQRSQDEEAAARGIVFPDFSVRMMSDCVRFFNLHSFEEAEKVPVSEWLTIFQIDASSALLQYNFNKIIEEKQKRKQKK